VLEKAMSFYDQALKIEPTYINALFNQHAIWLDQGHIDNAIHNLQKILNINPNDHEVMYLLLHLHQTYQNQSMAHYEDLLSQANDLSQISLKRLSIF
jgi:tetratricopeptide (TPR) repeat protein